MHMRELYLLGLIGAVLGQDDNDFSAEASSISAELSSPTFVPYTKPNNKVEEFIALGDSYTAGTGCNGFNEIIAADATRGKRAYPMQMSTDADNWGFINGDTKLPRFSFHAYTGDTTIKMVTEQLKQGNYKDDKGLPRGQPFGKPQLAVATIGGNDARLGDILNDCIYRAWFPKDCQETLGAVKESIDNGKLRNEIMNALYHVVHAGREAGGADPIEAFQVYVPSYITFFNDQETACDEFSWNWWGYNTPKLTTQLRKQLNDMTKDVSEVVKAATKDLEPMGVIYVEGLEEEYNDHRFCEKRHTEYPMTDYETWFWSPYAKMHTTSEGPGDPNNADSAEESDPKKELLDFIFPGEDNTAKIEEGSEPWKREGADKYPDFQSLMTAIQEKGEVNATAVPFNTLRTFHPKGTAYGHHKDLIFAAIADNRDEVGAADDTAEEPADDAEEADSPPDDFNCDCNENGCTEDSMPCCGNGSCECHCNENGCDSEDPHCCANGTCEGLTKMKMMLKRSEPPSRIKRGLSSKK